MAQRQDSAGIEKVRKRCLSRGLSSIRYFSQAFRQFDTDFSKQINFSEFQTGLQQYSICMTEEQQKELFDEFDKDCDGYIDFQEFYQKLAPPLTGRRLEIVKEVFKTLDKNNDGFICSADVMDLLEGKAKRHEKYLSGEWSIQEVVENLLMSMQQSEKSNITVTEVEFVEFYRSVSTCVEEDSLFEGQLKGSWGIN